MDINQIPVNLEHKLYRGQLFKSFTLRKEGVSSYIEEEIKAPFIKKSIELFLKSAGEREGLLDYEKAVIKKIIEDEKNVFISHTILPGIHRVIGLLSSLNFYLKGLSVLIVTSSKAETVRIKRYLDKFNIIESFSDEDIRRKEFDYTTNVLISDFSYLIKEIFNKREERFSKWLGTLGLIIVHNITSFSTLELIQLAKFLNILRVHLKEKRDKEPLFLFTGNRIQNPDSFIKNFLPNINIETLTPVFPYSEFSVYYWIPPRIVDTEERKIKKEDSYQEVRNLVEMIKEKGDILFIQGHGNITPSNLKKRLGDRILIKKIIPSLMELDEEDFYSYDYIILLGLPRDVKYALDVIPHLLKPDGKKTIFFVLPSEPVSFYFLKRDKSIEDFDYPDILLLNSSFESNSKVFTPSETEPKYLSYQDFPNLPFEGMQGSEGIVKIKFPDDTYWYIDKSLIPERIFADSLIRKDGILYEIQKIDERNWSANPINTDIVERVPILELKDLKLNSEPVREYKIANAKIKLYKDLQMTIKFQGYKEFKDYSNEFDIIEKQEEEYEKKIPGAVVVELPDSKISHSFSHLLKILLSLKFRNYDVLEILHKDNLILVYSPYRLFDFEKYITPLRSIIFNELPEFSVDLLLSLCSCHNGCPLCLDIMECNKKDKDFNKKETIEFFMETKNSLNTSLNRLKLRLKYNGIEDKNEAYDAYKMIRDRILRIYKEIFGVYEGELSFKVETLSNIELPQTEIVEAIIAGRLRERDVYWKVAYEYGHQIILGSTQFINLSLTDKGKIPLEGKLFSEGATEYLAFRVSDPLIQDEPYYGEEKPPRFFRYDEYSDGFKILCWLENKVGLFGVLKFLNEGKIEIDGKVYGPDEVIKEAGLK